MEGRSSNVGYSIPWKGVNVVEQKKKKKKATV